MNFEPIHWRPVPGGALPEAAWRWLADRLGMPALLATPARTIRDIQLAPSRLPDTAREKFAALLGANQVRSDAAARIQYCGDGGLIDTLRRQTGDLARAPDAVLSPRTESEVVAVVRASAELNVTIGASDARASVVLDLTQLTRLDFDTMSGLVTAESGIGSAELARRLEARGLGADVPAFDALGDCIAASRDTAWLQRMRVATPLGQASELRDLAAGSHGAFGVITAATLRTHALAAAPQHRRYLFPDFAAGLAALHQAAKGGVAHAEPQLSDAAATNFARGLARVGHPFDLLARLHDIHREIRHFDDRASALSITFTGTKARKAFEALVRRLGGMRLHGEAQAPDFKPLLERGVNTENFTVTANWSKLPVLYAAARQTLDQAMRVSVPRPGAHGVVLASVTGTRPDGATLALTAIYPRRLDDWAAQAEAVHRAGTDALASSYDTPSQAARGAIKQAMDPKNILPPL